MKDDCFDCHDVDQQPLCPSDSCRGGEREGGAFLFCLIRCTVNTDVKSKICSIYLGAVYKGDKQVLMWLVGHWFGNGELGVCLAWTCASRRTLRPDCT